MCEDTVQQILSLFSGLLTPIIAIIAVYIAWQQYKTHQRRLHLEKYDRSLALYAEIKKILSLIMRDADVSTEELVRFRTAKLPRPTFCSARKFAHISMKFIGRA
jgi:hypothetical protein